LIGISPPRLHEAWSGTPPAPGVTAWTAPARVPLHEDRRTVAQSARRPRSAKTINHSKPSSTSTLHWKPLAAAQIDHGDPMSRRHQLRDHRTVRGAAVTHAHRCMASAEVRIKFGECGGEPTPRVRSSA
jgi:hypothetical protein